MSNNQSPGDDNLAALIRQAEGEVSRGARKPQPAQHRNLLRPAMGAMLVVLALYSFYGVWRMFAPPSEETVTHDLDVALDAARKSVEQAKAESGQLPEALPSASLGSVVRYEHGRSDYRLSATILGIRVTLEQDGKKTIEKGVQQ